MEGRKEAFRMYLEETGATDALTKCIIKLYELKDERPDTPEAAFEFMKKNLSNDFPSQDDYDKLLKEVEESRAIVQAIRKAEEDAKEAARRKAEEKAEQKAKKKEAKADWTKVIQQFNDLKDKCSSLLVKHLTTDMINKLKDKRTSNQKTLLDCIKIGLDDPSLPVGIYAADIDAYDVFAEIFDRIIAEYYGVVPATIQHPPDDTWAGVVSELKDLDASKGKIKSTKITCSRSLTKKPFFPAMNEADCSEVMNEIIGPVLEKSKFQRKKIGDDDLKTLIADNQTLKLDDDRLKAVAVYEKQNLLAVVNGEDHLKFISTAEGGNFELAFESLKSGVQSCTGAGADKLQFARSEKLGWITSCPTNLGSTIHASVIMNLSNLRAYYGDVKEIAEKKMKSKICVTPITTTVGDYEISNIHKLGKSEFFEVKEMYDAIARLLNKENTCIPTVTIADMTAAKTRLAELKTRDCISLLVKYLDETSIGTLVDDSNSPGSEDAAKVEKLLACIKPGLEDPNLSVGIYANTAAAYTDFKDIFKLIVKATHDFVYDPATNAPPDDWTITTTLDSKFDKYVKSTRMSCCRSIETCSFYPAMTEDKYKQVLVAFDNVRSKFTGDLKGDFYKLENMDDTLKSIIDEHHLFEMNKSQREAAKAWSKYLGVFMNEKRTLLIVVNDVEHFKFISIAEGNALKETVENLRRAVAQVNSLGFAICGDLGAITSCPSNLGSIDASVVLTLPKLHSYYGDVKKLAEKTMKLNICVEPSATDGEYKVSNKKKLGMDQATTVTQLVEGVTALLEKEEKVLEKVATIKTLDDAKVRWEKIKSLNCDSLLVTKLKDETFAKANNDVKKECLLECIKAGLADPNLPVGIYAFNKSAYTDFDDLFNEIITSSLSPKSDPCTPDWDSDINVLTETPVKGMKSIRMACSRTIINKQLLPAMTKDDYKTVMTLIEKLLKQCDADEMQNGTLHKLNDPTASKDQMQMIKEHRLFQSNDQQMKEVFATKDWQEGRAIYVNASKTLLVAINDEDHLKFIAIGDEFKTTFQRLGSIVKEFEEKVKAEENSPDEGYLSHKYGCVTTSPTNMGTIHTSVLVEFDKLCNVNVVNVAEPLGIDVEQSATSKKMYELSYISKLEDKLAIEVAVMQKAIDALVLADASFGT